MTGLEVKKLIKSHGLKVWQVADKWGLSDGNFSRRLRKPFSDEEVERLKNIISELLSHKNGGTTNENETEV